MLFVELNDLLLVLLARVKYDDRDAAVEEFVERFDMHGRIGADRPVARKPASAHHAREGFSGPTTREAVA